MVGGILACNCCGLTDVKTLMQGLPLDMPIATPTMPGIAIHSFVLSLRTCSMVLPGIRSPFWGLEVLLCGHPLRPTAVVIAPMLNTISGICLLTDSSLKADLGYLPHSWIRLRQRSSPTHSDYISPIRPEIFYISLFAVNVNAEGTKHQVNLVRNSIFSTRVAGKKQPDWVFARVRY